MLYVRMFVHCDDVFGWLGGRVGDHTLIDYSMTVGEFACRLLHPENLGYDGLRLPRLPIKLQQAITARISQSVQPLPIVEPQERSRSREKRRNHKR